MILLFNVCRCAGTPRMFDVVGMQLVTTQFVHRLAPGAAYTDPSGTQFQFGDGETQTVMLQALVDSADPAAWEDEIRHIGSSLPSYHDSVALTIDILKQYCTQEQVVQVIEPALQAIIAMSVCIACPAQICLYAPCRVCVRVTPYSHPLTASVATMRAPLFMYFFAGTTGGTQHQVSQALSLSRGMCCVW